MADNTIVENGNDAPFVQDEFDAGEADIYPGHALEIAADGDVVKHATESGIDAAATGLGLFADLNEFDPSTGKGDAYPNGERVGVVHVPVGGRVDARLAAGGDLDTAADANVTEGDVLEEADVGGLKAHTGVDTVGDGTGAASETVYDAGALYVARESVDNSGAAAGVENQQHIEVVRIA